MNDRKLKRLIELARAEAAPAPPEGFDARVMMAVCREKRAAPVSLLDLLDQLFPRLAFAAVLVMGLCVAADFCIGPGNSSSLSADVNEISEQWLFGTGGQ